MTRSWQQRLDAATSEEHVVAVARDFVAQLGSDVLERLPAELRPGKFDSAAEVTAYAFAVVMHRVKGGGADIAEQVQLIANFFMGAATRLTQIMASRLGEASNGA